MDEILILHGPNLNLLGDREPEFYGSLTLEEINKRLTSYGQELGVKVRTLQSNHEGALIDALQDACSWARGVVFNPGGYTHTSVALRDTIVAIRLPVVEVHLSNVDARETFRRKSVVSGACRGKITGFGWRSYELGVKALVDVIKMV